uniref:Receptor-like serine/threonine-protein kinase n=1 Tax=Opuntia streptacantha TaxID=393608 RepID=A0A7C8ZZZ8_OPUST
MPTFSLLLLLLFLFFFLSPLKSSSDSGVLLRANSTILSPNGTFELGFFTPNQERNTSYLGIWYASLPTRPYVWVANRQTPVKDLSSASLSLSSDGRLAISAPGNAVVWRSDNRLPGGRLSLLESGNLVLVSSSGDVVWQSFDYPTDTWLPGMNITVGRSLTSWNSMWDPSPGRYSLRMRSPGYGEIELVYNSTTSYWKTGNWTGDSFVNVPEMTVRYIYRFYFDDPFTKTASFGFSEVPAVAGLRPPLTRFQLSFTGQLQQYTWSPQTENWNMFWTQPDARCRAYGLCGANGLCYENSGLLTLKVCDCPPGFEPVDEAGWAAGDFAGGCRRVGGSVCDEKSDGFEEIGAVSFDEAKTVSYRGIGNKGACERDCLGNCSCIGIVYNEKIHLCKNLFGSLLNLRNLTSDSTLIDRVLFLRVGKNGLPKKNQLSQKVVILISVISGLIAVSMLMVLVLFISRRTAKRRKRGEEEAALAATHLKVFSYKELHGATRGFSEKLGHGGFGTVFQGILSDSSHVAVKRLERPGNGGEKEFRAEVCTIGSVQHVNLVRLRGFCSENSHRLLVYDYMPNGPLSAYLKKDGLNMGWDVRYRVAIGTARALAYLHEECRDCIIHCDIKPENILLDWDYVAKVADFGMAKLIGRDFSRVLATMRGTWGYVAPEWISGLAITTKADVYSYGMTMLELIGGRRNVEAPPPSNGNGGVGDKWFFPPWAARMISEGNVGEVVDRRLGVAYDKAEAERLGMVAVWCIQDEEDARPSMGMVVKMLEGVVEVGVPPPPKLLQALVAGDSFPGVKAAVESGDGVGVCSDDNMRASVDSVSYESHSPRDVSPLGSTPSV